MSSINYTNIKLSRFRKGRILIFLQVVVFSLFVINLKAGTPHTVGGTVTYSEGGSPSSATFSAYITSRPAEVLTHSSSGCGYGGGSYWIQCGNFTTSWTAGEVLHVDLSDGMGGSTSDEVVLTTNSADQLNLIIYSPDIDINPSSANYGSVELWDNSTKSITVTNTGGSTLSVTSTTLTGTDADEFSITGGGGSFSLSSGESHTIYVQFSPSSEGSKSASLSISSNDADENPSYISLSGTGTTIPNISALPNPAYYGNVLVWSYSDNTIVVSNDGTGDLAVSSTTITGPQSGEYDIHSGGGSFTLAPGATRNIVVRFNPSSTGSKDASLSLSNNDPNENPYHIALNGSGVQPDIDVSPGSMNYGDVEITGSSTETFVISNTGGATLSVTSSNITGTNQDEFSITSGGGSFTLSPGATRNLDVRFNPASTGVKSATLRIASDDPDEVPKDIALVGNGIALPDISVSPDPVDCGIAVTGSYSDNTITVGNDGTGTLSVSTTTLTGTHAGEFSIQSGGGTSSIIPGGTHDVIVRFSPASSGSKNASLQISSNDPDENPFTISLIGTGVEIPVPSINVSPDSHNYGDVYVDSIITRTFVVKNNGVAELSVTLVSITGENSEEFSIIGGGSSFSLAPEATHNIDISFGPASAGLKNAGLHFESNDPDQNTYDVKLSGNGLVIPDIAISPESKDYGDVIIGSGSAQIFTITNEGTGSLSVTSSIITGTHSGEFNIAAGDSSFILTPGSYHDIEVSFNPDSTGSKNGILRIISDDPDESPLDIILTGNGVDVPVPFINIEPQSYNYGDVLIDSSVIKTLIISNEGTADLSVVSMVFEGEHQGDYNIVSDEMTFILAPDSTKEIRIRFIPDAHGIRNASLVITSNDPDKNISDVTLTGTGIILDTVSPYLVNCFPSEGALSIPVNSAIQFKIKDNINGVDISTVDLYVNENLIISGGVDQTGGDVEMMSLDQHYTICYHPDSNLPEETRINVQVQCNDLAPDVNSLDSTYSFHTATCSKLALASDTVGPEGGIVYDDFTGFQIDIPDSALNDSTVITINLVNVPPEISDTVVGIGLSYYLGPDGFVFNDSIVIGIPYTHSDLMIAGVTSPLDIPVYTYTSSSGKWIQLEKFDYDDNFVYVKVTDFGYLTLCRLNIITDIKDIVIEPQLSQKYVLYQNYPNPFADRTLIQYQIPEYGFVNLEVYSITGMKVKTLVNEYKESGSYEVMWYGKDDSGNELQKGTYIYILKSKNQVIIEKALLLK